jgi:hypothetical protein
MVALDGGPRAVIDTPELTRRRFHEADAAFADDEGDRSRATAPTSAASAGSAWRWSSGAVPVSQAERDPLQPVVRSSKLLRSGGAA